MAELRIGTSGWHYQHWAGIFYPEGLSKNLWFSHYASRFDTVEINNTFYRLPTESAFEAWRAQAPPGFVYALKFSRYGSHLKKLQQPAEPLQRFLGRAELLQPFVGPILVQLPPGWRVNVARLREFLELADRRWRWAVELRDPSWLTPEVYRVLRDHQAALCWHDLLEDHPTVVTAPWVYLRYHGASAPGGNYSRERLRVEAERVRRFLAEGLGVFAYFNNDAHGHAVANATRLKAYVLG